MDIKLSSDIFIIKKILKKTSAKGFKEFKEGTMFYITTTIEKTTGGSGGGLYATYFRVHVFNEKDQCFDYSITESQNTLISRLQCFEYNSSWLKPNFIEGSNV